MPSMPRRQTLTLLGRSAAALALGSLFGPVAAPVSVARPRYGSYPFSLGVASGMPRPDSVVLWTRLAPQPQLPGHGLPDAPLPVRWELADDEGFAQLRASGELLALPQHAHSVHVEVRELPPGRSFFYRFISGDAVSTVGRTRTAPAPDAAVQRLRLALASCQHYEHGRYAAHREIAARELDFVLFVGDYIYESSSRQPVLRPHDGPEPLTLEAYRRRHAHYKRDPDLQAAHAAHPWLLTWDDHEVQNDYADAYSAGLVPPEDFLRRRAAAYKAYFEHMPVSPAMAPDGPAMRIHERFTWGRLAELWTLDGRQFRSPQACGDGRRGGGRVLMHCSELDDERRTLLGTGQERWLHEGLRASARRWKLIGQGSQISSSSVQTPFGRAVYSDAWDGYPRARERLLAAIAEARVSDVIALGGDVHRHVAAQLRLRPNDARSPILASEFVTTSLSSRGIAENTVAMMQRSNPDVVHARGDQRGYAFVELTPGAALCDFRATDFPLLENAPLHSQARYVVEAGRPGVQHTG
ncbi:alkaline phosphatase D family protein [Caldimonas tepidiphila]|uniref:alkaline phosphatase D family protein n=1 Tax=Caldimonas tepidiphila TaxID=2315841 RepID=UPI000E5B3DE8|nr:alkaline phosphatase D family protein [Caldimonas tepidiphila]